MIPSKQRVVANTCAYRFQWRVNELLNQGWRVVEGSLKAHEEAFAVVLEKEQ